MFQLKYIDLGVIAPNIEQVLNFPYSGDIRIAKLISPCDCSIPSDNRKDKNNKSIMVHYTPKEVPAHLIFDNVGEYKADKLILVEYYEDSKPQLQQEELKFSVTVKHSPHN